MKRMMLITAILSLIGIWNVLPSAAEGKTPVAECPDVVEYVDVEAKAGKYDPPAFLIPTWDNGRTGIDLYNEWTDLAGEDVMIHCHMKKPENAQGEVVKVKLAPEINKCMRFRDKVSCFVAPVKPKAKTPATPSPTAQPAV
ncbi:MAG: hypothetical protein WAZ18_06650 [Alphaproteobacteria bacterium]